MWVVLTHKERVKRSVEQSMEEERRGTWPADPAGRTFLGLFALWAAYVASEVAVARRGDMWPILASFLATLTCRALLHRFSPSRLFTNTFLSLLSSALIGFSAAGIAWKQWREHGSQGVMKHQQLMYGTWGGAHALLCFCSGFFMFDAFDLLRARLHRPWTLLHHAVLLVCINMALLRQVGINYLVFTLICEIHSIFTHLRRILRMVGLRQDGSWAVKVEWVLHWLSFFTTRLLLHLLITIKVLLDASSFASGIEWPLALAGMLGQDILNVLLGCDLYKAFLRETHPKRKSKKVA